jgi:hypothetical protein
MFDLALHRRKKLCLFDLKEDSALIIEAYYEIIKEMTVALMSLDGKKADDHRDIVKYLLQYDFMDNDVFIFDYLRKRRNMIVYEGKNVPVNYIERNKKHFEDIILKLSEIILSRFKN